MEKKPLTVGIVGGGIAGLYCAWKLAQVGHHVVVYECLDRLGGRIETLDLDGFKAECGPMRFECAIQPLFKTLVTEQLGIEFAPFTPYKGEKVTHPLYMLHQDEKCREQIDKELAAEQATGGRPVTGFEFSHLTSSLDLLKLGVFRMLNPDQRHLTLQEVVEERDGAPPLIREYADRFRDGQMAQGRQRAKGYEDYDEIRSSHTLELDGEPLHQIGFWNALARVLSPNAVTKIRDIGTFYHLMPDNPSASEWAIFWLRGFRSDADLSTIGAGVETIVERLVARIKGEFPLDQVHLETNATVRGVVPGGTVDKVRLEIEFGERHQSATPTLVSHEFDHVILALPKWPLKRLDTAFPQQIRNDVEGVVGLPLLKAFLVMEDPWWDDQTPAQRGANLVPTRELHYFVRPVEDDAPSVGMVMLYTDRPATAYWQPYVKKPHEHAQVDHPNTLRDELVRHLILDLKHFAVAVAKEAQTEQPVPPTQIELPEEELLKKIQDGLIRSLREVGGAPGAHVISEGVDLGTVAQVTTRLSQRAMEMVTRCAEDGEEEMFADEKERVTRFAIRDWSQPPFGAACHAWTPGVHVLKALGRLKAFSLVGCDGVNNLHVCGEAYSDYQGFIEGALRSAEAVLSTIPASQPPSPTE